VFAGGFKRGVQNGTPISLMRMRPFLTGARQSVISPDVTHFTP
jgi:hypothetical protein